MKKYTLLVTSVCLFSVAQSQSWSLTGNAGTNPKTNFLGTRDNRPLRFRIVNQYAGEIDSATQKTFFGYGAGKSTTASDNMAIGYLSLNKNSAGYSNAAIGNYTLRANTTGFDNTASGGYALSNNTTGSYNTAVGTSAMWYNMAGVFNTAVGTLAMLHNEGSLGHYNTAVGAYALYSTTNSQYNTVVGYRAGFWYDMGYNNTILGANCDISGPGMYNCIAIGQQVTCTASSQARIGNLATNSIGGQVGWTTFSDARYKKDLNENVIGLDFIMKLRPVTYHLDVSGLNNKLREDRNKEMNKTLDAAIAEKEKMLYTGFVAQEVEQAAKEVGYDFSGVDKPKNKSDFYGLRYAEFVVPLVKAVQELSDQNTDLKKQISELLKRIEKLESSYTLKN